MRNEDVVHKMLKALTTMALSTDNVVQSLFLTVSVLVKNQRNRLGPEEGKPVMDQMLKLLAVIKNHADSLEQMIEALGDAKDLEASQKPVNWDSVS